MPFLAVYETARQTLLQLAKSRFLWLLLPVELVVLAIPWLWSHQQSGRLATGDEAFPALGYWIYICMLVPWVAMFFGIQSSHGDVEDRTFQYLFLRPVPRWSLLLGKWLASALMAGGAMVLGLCMLWAAVALLPFSWNDGVPDVRLLWIFGGTAAIAAVAYSAVAVLFGAWFRRPLLWSVLFIVGLEYFLANLPPQAGVRSLTVADPLRRLLLRWWQPPVRISEMLWGQRDYDPEHLGNPQGSLVLLVAVCLFVAVWVYSRAEYDSRERE